MRGLFLKGLIVAIKKTGSYVSEKQMARAAIEGQLIKFKFTSGSAFEGYLSGMDAYNWLVVNKSGTTHIVHKTNVELLEITNQFLFQEDRETLENVTLVAETFWKFCEKEFFGRTEE